jgi:hypothetical protein
MNTHLSQTTQCETAIGYSVRSVTDFRQAFFALLSKCEDWVEAVCDEKADFRLVLRDVIGTYPLSILYQILMAR